MRRNQRTENDFAWKEDFEEKVVDLFFRSNKMRKELIKFDDLTAFLIEHEIETSIEGVSDSDKLYKENKEV